MNIFGIFRRKPKESPEEELRQVEFKLRHGYGIDRERLEARRRELEKLVAQKPEQN